MVSLVAGALASVLGLAPAGGPPVEGPAAASTEPRDASPATGGPARLVLGPDLQGTIAVHDAQGHEVAAVALRPGRRTLVELPAGRYALVDAQGRELTTLRLHPDEVRGVDLPELAAHGSAPPRPTSPPRTAGAAVATGRLGATTPDDALAEAEREVELVRRRPWARWAAPLVSAVVPGAGQAINRQPGRGLAVFTGTVGLVLGAVATWAARDPSAGAAAGTTGGDAREIARLAGLSGLATAAGLLYVGQILDAHAQAAHRRPPRPARDHVIALEVSRSSTVAFAAGRPSYDLYADWSLAIMGQVFPRVTLGLSDASIKRGRPRDDRDARDMLTVQAGVRATYRFFDRRRVWLAVGGGAIVQGTRANVALTPLSPDPDAPRPDAERAFSVVPYGLFDARLFLLDRWSLGLVPRVSLPLATRRFGGGRALPRYATTFELGAVMGVYF